MALTDAVPRKTWPSEVKITATHFQILYITFLFVTCIIRAASQSVVSAEASMYDTLPRGGFSYLFQAADFRDNFLTTYLCFITSKLFGFGELSLRTPGVLGALIYMLGCRQLCNWAFTSENWASLTLVWLTLNPFILDLMVFGQGHGLGLGFVVWLMYYILCVLSNEDVVLRRIGYLAGLTVCANLAFLVPVLGLLVTLLAIEVSRSRKRALVKLIRQVLGPALVVFIVIAGIPLSKAGEHILQQESASLPRSVESLVQASLHYKTPFGDHFKAIRLMAAFTFWTGRLVGWLLVVTLPLALRSLKNVRLGQAARDDALLLVTGGTLISSVSILLLSNIFSQAPYPFGKDGAYLLVLGGLYLASVVAALSRIASPARRFQAAVAFIICTQTVMFAFQWNPRYFYLWRSEARIKYIAQIIAGRHDQDDTRKLTIGAAYGFRPSLNYYVQNLGMTWVNHLGLTPVDAEYDFYVLSRAEEALIAKRHLVLIYRDKLSGAMLARQSNCSDVTEKGETKAW
jgi:hypothetical protein